MADSDQKHAGQVNLPRQMAAATRDPELLRAGMALADNDLPTAESLLRPYLKRRPTDVAAIRMMAELAARIGRLADSENLLRRALDLAPDFTAARANLATVLYKQHRSADAIAELEAIEREGRGNLGHSSLKAAALSRIGGHEEALALYRTILDSRPDQPKLWMSYGHTLKTVGQLDEGVEAYRRAIALQPTLGEVWWSLANLKTIRFDDRDTAAMEQALETAGLADDDRFHLHFALGKAFEDRGEAERSFGHYAEGNRLRRALIDYDSSIMGEHVRRSIDLFTPDFFEARANWGNPAPDPIFIVGLPRAGSTLIEQILASHPAIEGTTELPDIPMIAKRLGGRAKPAQSRYPADLADLDGPAVRALGDEYLERASAYRLTDRPYFIDKLPNNWAHAGLIQLILPNAKIIDARRHPLACGFSNFKQHFARGQGFAYDLSDIGKYYADYVALMRHFRLVRPSLIHRVINEDLIEDPEREVRALLDYLGLPFNPACLAFHENPRAVRTPSAEQVRRPISREGVDQWRPFEPWLAPLKAGLGAMMEQWRD